MCFEKCSSGEEPGHFWGISTNQCVGMCWDVLGCVGRGHPPSWILQLGDLWVDFEDPFLEDVNHFL